MDSDQTIDAIRSLGYTSGMNVLHSGADALVAGFSCALSLINCSRPDQRNSPPVDAAGPGPSRSDRGLDAALPLTVPAAVPTLDEGTIRFAWKPTSAKATEYSMSDPEDQHRVILMRGVEKSRAYPVVVALHGQPRRGQAPRSYVFPRVVADEARELVRSRVIEPFVLVTPVFRFEGQNWPNFGLTEFMVEVRRILLEQGVVAGGTYYVGHSGAAGCGGGGLNRVAEASPTAVGFFDTCVGAGFVQQARALAKLGVPTLIIHSVETAGSQPRQPSEYDANFDFGRVYTRIGLHAAPCPTFLPDAPLRRLPFRCAINDTATTQALVIDTGAGEKAHEALVPVALRYFLSRYLNRITPNQR